MTATLDTMSTDGHVVIPFDEASIPAKEREEFVLFVKAQWRAMHRRLSSEWEVRWRMR
jgi:hypothetical protein